MPFQIIRDDITHVKADALVNAANPSLRCGGGVCGAIFAAAGSQKLQAACDKIGHCDTGNAVATRAFALPARYVIHAVGPIWQGGTHGERGLLASCYRTSLELAASLKCKSIAFPLISAGIYGYPRREALEVAQQEIRSFLDTHEMNVTLVLFDSGSLELADDLRLQVERYIDDVYVDESGYSQRRPWENQVSFIGALQAEDEAPSTGAQGLCPRCGMPIEAGQHYCLHCGADLRAVEEGADLDSLIRPEASMPEPSYSDSKPVWEEAAPLPSAPPPAHAGAARPSFGSASASNKQRERQKLPSKLRSMLSHMDAGFSETLLAMIDERDLKDSQVYKSANLSRQHFSKIRSNPRYKPSKQTVLALAIALQLSLEDTQLLLERAGFALSHADRRDVIVEFFITQGIYDVFTINQALFSFDQPLLG